MNILGKIGEGFSILNKTVSLGASVTNIGVTIYATKKFKRKLTTSDKIKIGCEVVFSLAQGVDLGFSAARFIAPRKIENLSQKLGTSSAKIGVGTSVVSGLVDVGRSITYIAINPERAPLDFVDVIAVVVFRFGDAVNQAKKIQDLSPQDKVIVEWLGVGATVGSTGISATTTGIRVYRNREKVWEATKKILSFIFKKKDAIPVLSGIAENEKQLEELSRKTVLQVSNWPKLEVIPELLWEDKIFDSFKCAITGNPIRIPMKPINGTQKVWYDKKALEAWFKNHPNEKPNLWPENLDCVAKNCMRDKKVQDMIEKQLAFYAQLYKQESNRK